MDLGWALLWLLGLFGDVLGLGCHLFGLGVLLGGLIGGFCVGPSGRNTIVNAVLCFLGKNVSHGMLLHYSHGGSGRGVPSLGITVI